MRKSFAVVYVALWMTCIGAPIAAAQTHAIGETVIRPANYSSATDRRKVTSRHSHWLRFGELRSPLGVCSAQMVGRRLVLTNAHCVVSRADGRDIFDGETQAEVRMAIRAGAARLSTGVVKFWTGWDADRRNGAASGDRGFQLKDDWAILLLASPLGDQLGWLGVSETTPAQLQRIFERRQTIFIARTTSFAGGGWSHFQSNCGFRGWHDRLGLFLHDCAVDLGASGGAFIHFVNRRPYVFALHSGVWRPANAVSASATSFSARRVNGGLPTQGFYRLLVRLKARYR